MYMLSLQSKSNVPFRVVDEINQGIDPRKERLALGNLSAVTTRFPAQYFIATPKLLPGLQFPKDATVLFVFNGPENLTQKEWDQTSFFLNGAARRRTSSVGGNKRIRAAAAEEEEEEEARPAASSRAAAARARREGKAVVAAAEEEED